MNNKKQIIKDQIKNNLFVCFAAGYQACLLKKSLATAYNIYWEELLTFWEKNNIKKPWEDKEK